MELVPQERRKLLVEGLPEVDEQELTRLVRERPVARLQHDLGDELVEPVHRGDAVAPATDEEASEHRAVEERGDPERRERGHVEVQRPGVVARPVRGEDVVGGAEEDEPERALHVDEELVAEPHEQRQHDGDNHSGEREHAREHRPARARLQELERSRGRDRGAAGEDEDDVAQEEQEGDLPVQAVRLVHALEPAEEGLDRAEPRAENEVEGERAGPGQRQQHRDARQRRVAPVEARVERGGLGPQDQRRPAERSQEERAAKADEAFRREAHVCPTFRFLDGTSRYSHAITRRDVSSS